MDGYRLDALGWLQFERLAELALASAHGLRDLDWSDRAYRARVAWTGDGVVAVVWIRAGGLEAGRVPALALRVERLAEDLGLRASDRLLVVTNLDESAHAALPAERAARTELLGASGLGRIADRDPALRAALPSLLGLRDLEPLIEAPVRERSHIDIPRAQELARVFVPTHAYDRARRVLARHRFVVLTGPPEMGKTAIARMVALAQLTTGWEAHECTSPEQVWAAFDRERAQVFVADDAFGSTEYRPDAAEHWARELGPMLAALDERHWLIWTSRPAPLRAGLRRVQRERGSERFPQPGEVLVDASDLDLAEKTLILYRHAKDHSKGARLWVREAGLEIVEHPHFTPERVRRFAARIDRLMTDSEGLPSIDAELSAPTEAMTSSFRALGEEHRALLVALLDAPAGLTDERELAATLRRHRPAGLSRPPRELIDRLTDHFLRISSLGIDWVHPSWRDVVIDELRADGAARRRFLRACGPYGALLALSSEGGATGTRLLPLLAGDDDWDAFADRAGELVRELSDAELARLLLAFAEALRALRHDPLRRDEADSLASYVLRAARRLWDRRDDPLPVFLLEAWYALAARASERPGPPAVAAIWAELHPAGAAFAGERAELLRTVEWLALAAALDRYDRETLAELGFPERERATLKRLATSMCDLAGARDPDVVALAEQVLARLVALAPEHAPRPAVGPMPADFWWEPKDIDEPPSTERVTRSAPLFERADVDRVLRDL